MTATAIRHSACPLLSDTLEASAGTADQLGPDAPCGLQISGATARTGAGSCAITKAVLRRPIRILGIDPGLRRTGWGVVEIDGNRLTFVACGSVATDDKAALAQRLLALHDGLFRVVEEFVPHEAAVEATFVNKDAAATLKLGQARGIAMLVPARASVPVAEYAPNLVKKTIVGAGHGEKAQIRMMIGVLLPKADPQSARCRRRARHRGLSRASSHVGAVARGERLGARDGASKKMRPGKPDYRIVWFFLAIGVASFALGAWAAVNGALTLGWPRAAGRSRLARIISLHETQRRDQRSPDRRHTFAIAYVYTVDGQRYLSHGIEPDDFGMQNSGDAVKLANTHRIGSKVAGRLRSRPIRTCPISSRGRARSR